MTEPADGVRARHQAFTLLVHEHYSSLLALSVRILHDREEAEDCTQETFAEAFRTLHTLLDPGALTAWLRAIVRRRCWRRLRRRDLYLLPFASDVERLVPPVEPSLEPCGEALAYVRGLVDELPSHEREAVVLFYFKQCTQLEIAAFLSIPITTVNNRLHQARQRLRKWSIAMQDTGQEAAPRSLDGEGAPTARVGTVISVEGPLVQVRFDADAPLELFDALAMVGSDGTQRERMKVCRPLGDGMALCLVTQGDGAIPLGASVLNTQRVGLGLTFFRRPPSVSVEHLKQAIRALRDRAPVDPSPHQPRLLETGIKAIDLLCPLTQDGLAAQVGTAGVGRMVLLEELGRRLRRAASSLETLCLVAPSEPNDYRGWQEAATHEDGGNLKAYWALSAEAADPHHDCLAGCDAVLYLSPVLALQGLYPALDPEHSWSRLLREERVSAAHAELARRARTALTWAKQAYTDPVALELLACRAHAAAQSRSRDHQPSVPPEQRLELERARKLQLFLSQPFDAAKELTGWDGCHVALADTLDGTRAILDGDVDRIPSEAFAYGGTLDEVRLHAEQAVARRHG